jgi:DNA-binding IclR family transcriptional regulator
MRGLDRAFEILEFLRVRQQPMRPNEIAGPIGAPRSSVYELVNLLLRHGMLEYCGGDGRVFLGRRLFFLGNAYAQRLDLFREAEELLIRLAENTGETSQLCMLEGNKYIVAMMREGIRPFRISSDVGEMVPIPWTASGRLLVGDLSDAGILDFIPAKDFVLPDGRSMDPRVFIAEVRKACAEGFFTFNSVVADFTHCLAVPVRQADGHCIATLCLTTPREDGVRNRNSYLANLAEAAADLSGRLGFHVTELGRIRVGAP